jgi:membrane protein required for colicin V production
MSMLPSNGFDLLALVVVLFCVLTSLWRGAMIELFGLVGWIGAFLIARLYAEAVGSAFFTSLEPVFLRTGVAWVSIFIASLLIANLLGGFFKGVFAKVGLSVVDRLIGAVFGALKAFMVLLALVWLGGYTPLAKSTLFKESIAVRSSLQLIELIRQKHAFGSVDETPKNNDATPATTVPAKPADTKDSKDPGNNKLKLPAPSPAAITTQKSS